MEQNLPVISKRVWSIVRAVLFMMRKGIVSKKKLVVDLNMALKRGKIAGAKAIGNLMFHHRQVSPAAAVMEYEFSCSNTPNYIFPFNHKKKNTSNNYYHQFFACVHAPPTHDDDNLATMNAVKVVLEMLNNNDMEAAAVAASPMLPGFGQTPLVRQLRVTDSPFPLRDGDEDNGYVDKAAEDFINRFYKDLKQQNKILSEF
ncbi:Casein kinase I protein isoform 1 [Hibiscus syriacus]|uniref:Casein kinase I protein isoform 1 n=1 Tax=Hibiscus syriacus TaxID=106335 RepID=A0A6A2XLX7_HIBSY|nr:uncharacterized protein LOC120185613 [Hibiscus syriacus]KAE8662996.1 Casein kinase I protein isoform 1 [Hibiscus syriacus]